MWLTYHVIRRSDNSFQQVDIELEDIHEVQGDEDSVNKSNFVF